MKKVLLILLLASNVYAADRFTIYDLKDEKNVINKINSNFKELEDNKLDVQVASNTYLMDGDLQVIKDSITYITSLKRDTSTIEADITAIETNIDTVEATYLTNSSATANLSYRVASYGVIVPEQSSARAYMAGNLQNVNNAYVLLALDTKSYDRNSDYTNTASNYKFTAPVAGRYAVSAQIRWDGTISGNRYDVSVQKNGSEILWNGMYASANGQIVIPNVSDIIELAAGEYIQVYYNHNDVTDAADITGGSIYTYLAIALLN